MSPALRRLTCQPLIEMLDATSKDRDVPPEILEEINGAVRIGITLTSGSVLGEKLSLKEVVEIISPLDRNGALAVCAAWNRWNTWVMFHHGTWKPATDDRQRLLDELLPPRAHWRATAAFEDADFVSPFSEISVLALVSLVCRFSSDNCGRSMDERRSRRDLFRALLSLQESIFPENFFELSIPDQFPFEVRITLANISLQNRWAYDMGRLHALLTVPEISKSLNGITVPEWFLKRLGVDGVDYECVVTTLLGSAFYCADYLRLEEQAPALFKRMKQLLELSTTSAENVVRGLNESHPQPDPTELSEAIP